MQTKLHHWPTADPGGRFDDLFNFVYDPATLLVAFDRVADNTGANTPGVDGLTVTRWRPASGCWVAPRDIRPAETSIMR
jgi:RNA-directed DNA polymerase